MLAIFLAGGLVAFPVTVLIAATAATFGPWLGFLYAATGAIASALLTYFIGALLGRDVLRNWMGPRLTRIRERIVRQGVLAIAAIRMVPVAPFTLVNMVAGASGIRLLDYIAGTLLGLLPGLILMSALGSADRAHHLRAERARAGADSRSASSPGSADLRHPARDPALFGTGRLERPPLVRARHDLEHPWRIRSQPAFRSRRAWSN